MFFDVLREFYDLYITVFNLSGKEVLQRNHKAVSAGIVSRIPWVMLQREVEQLIDFVQQFPKCWDLDCRIALLANGKQDRKTS